MNHLGGDGFWLIREPDGRVRAIMAAGCAGHSARPDRYGGGESMMSTFESHARIIALCEHESRMAKMEEQLAALAQLPKAGVKDADALAYGTNLKKAGFVSGGGKVLKTSTAGEHEGVSRVFRWGSNRDDVVTALRALVNKIKEKQKEEAAKAVKNDASGLNNDLHGSAAYRAHLVGVVASRAVIAAG